MFSAFQANAFQANAFQIVSSGGTPPEEEIVGRGEFVHPYQLLKQDEYKRRAKEHRESLAQLDAQLQAVERQELLAQQQAEQAEAARLDELKEIEATLREQINRLRMERAWLMRIIDDEETAMVLLLSMPLH